MIIDIRRVASRVLRGVSLVLLVASLLLPITLLQLIFDEPDGGIWRYAKAANGLEVIFPDPKLETLIRNNINKQDGAIYASDLESLSGLVAWGKGITDISGLEYCTNFMGIRLQDNQISDISALANLTKLTYVHLGDNQITDISPLSELIKIQTLGLGGNKISDISPLSGLIDLNILLLNDNQIEDISPLVENKGFSGGVYTEHIVDLLRNPLNADSLNIYVPQLLGWGVTVYYDAVLMPTSTGAPIPDTTAAPAPDITNTPPTGTTAAPAPDITNTPPTGTTAAPLASSTDIMQPIIWVISGFAGGVLVSFLFLKILRKP